MKRIFKYTAIAAAMLILALAAAFAAIVIPLQSAPESQALDGIHFVSDGRSTIAIVPSAANQVLLVDSGMDGQAARVLKELSTLGMSGESVTAILFTHGHPDHIGGAKQFPQAERLALQADVDLIAGLKGAQGPVTRLFPVSPTGLKVDRVLQDGETLTVGGTTVKVFAVPGHTMGSAAYLINGVLFLGDSANATTSGKLQSAVWLFSDDLRLNEASLRGLANRLRGDGGAVQTGAVQTGAVQTGAVQAGAVQAGAVQTGAVHAIAFGHSGVLAQGLQPLTDWAASHPE